MYGICYLVASRSSIMILSLVFVALQSSFCCSGLVLCIGFLCLCLALCVNATLVAVVDDVNCRRSSAVLWELVMVVCSTLA